MESGTNKFDIICPLCGSTSINKKEEFPSDVLINLYKKTYNLDISYLAKNYELISYYHCKNCFLRYFYPDIGGDDKFYSLLQKKDNYYFKDKFEYQVVKKYFKKDKDVLEIGAGKGAFSKLINYKTYIGIELNESAIKLAKKEGVNLFYGSIHDFISKSENHEKYDIVCTFQVLEHVFLKDLNLFINSSIKALRKGGKMIIAVPSDSSFLGETPNSILNLPPHHLTRWSDDVFYEMEKIYNIKLVDLIFEPLKEINYHPFILNKFYKLLHYKRPIIYNNTPLFEKVINRCLRITPFVIKKRIINYFKPRGHSIIAVFEK